jgi:hypothetical protein
MFALDHGVVEESIDRCDAQVVCHVDDVHHERSLYPAVTKDDVEVAERRRVRREGGRCKEQRRCGQQPSHTQPEAWAASPLRRLTSCRKTHGFRD